MQLARFERFLKHLNVVRIYFFVSQRRRIYVRPNCCYNENDKLNSKVIGWRYAPTL